MIYTTFECKKSRHTSTYEMNFTHKNHQLLLLFSEAVRRDD